MERYFDAFLYLANWGTRHLMFRLPREVLDAETADLSCYTDAASLLETKDHLTVSLYADRDPDDYWEEAAWLSGSPACRQRRRTHCLHWSSPVKVLRSRHYSRAGSAALAEGTSPPPQPGPPPNCGRQRVTAR